MPLKKWLVLLAVALLPALCVSTGADLLAASVIEQDVGDGAAQLAYLEVEHRQYDSFIIGASEAAYNVEALNRYLKASFYNLSADGFGAEDPLALTEYILKHYKVKNLVLDLGAGEAELEALDMFELSDIAAEVRENWQRDIEKVGDPRKYQASHGADFKLPTGKSAYRQVPVEDVAAIRDLCAKRGVKLIVIASPIWQGQWEAYEAESLQAYRTALAQVVDYWDFSRSAVCNDSRYFYDAGHFRSAVGDMMLAAIFEDESVWRPEGFVTLVTKDNCQDVLNHSAAAMDTYTCNVPILLYHHIVERTSEVDSTSDITAAKFNAQMKAISEAGYTTVSFQEMIDYVYHGGSLPEKPICITFDDGYLSNYEVARPILEQYRMKATIFAIGSSVGASVYKDTELAITPHFSFDQAREMQESGTIDIQSHTYDMHQWAKGESSDVVRRSVRPVAGETDAAFAAALQADLAQYEDIRVRELGSGFTVLAYPNGHYSDLAERVIHESGIPVTVSTKTDCRNVLVRGLPQSLYALCRKNVTERTSIETLLAYLG